MKPNKRNEDRSVLALLYDEYRRTYPETAASIQHEIESFYHELFQKDLIHPDGVAAVFVGICDDQSRYAYEAGVKCGVQLAMDLELDSIQYGGGGYVSDL